MSTTETNGEANGDVAEVAVLGPNVHISSHPVLSHKITILRSSSTLSSSFRSLLREVTYHLGFEATSSLTTRPMKISVLVGHDHVEHTGSHINERVALIPILRSGLGLVDAMLELLPNAHIHHIGMYKDHKNQLPVLYYNRLPRKCESDIAYVLDPIIGTASTVMSVVGILKKVRF
jgi:uracil phosphoribosyltransferase